MARHSDKSKPIAAMPKRSTGPKTVVGKANSSHNALCHGLARCINGDDCELSALAGAVGAALGPELTRELSLDVARAKLVLSRIRAVRHAMLTELLGAQISRSLKRLNGLVRYGRAALKRALRSLRERRVDAAQKQLAAFCRSVSTRSSRLEPASAQVRSRRSKRQVASRNREAS